MKNWFLLFAAICFLVSTAFAGEPVVVDQTGTDYQNYWYVGTYGKQITLDDENKVHVAYQKTWCTETDTGYQVMYANVTDGTKMEIPSQEPGDPIQPASVFIGGGKNGTPVYLYYGVGGRMYSYYDSMHNQAMARVNSNGTAITPLGVQEGKSYYADAHYANPIAMEVDEGDGIAHCVFTNPGGDDVAYFNFDGTNFGDVVNLLDGGGNTSIKGKTVPEMYRRNGTKGVDLAINSDGTEITVATLHTASNILLHKGFENGDAWAEDFFEGLDNGDVIALFDTTDSQYAENIPNNDPKPFTDLQVKYDAEDNLHVVYEATYIEDYFDISADVEHLKFWWSNRLYGGCGDENGVFYDGTEHPKPQLRYWNSSMPAMVESNTHTLIAECEYPKAGETYKWFSKPGTADESVSSWGKYINDSIIGNVELVVNKDPQEGEPKMVCVWEETQGDTEVMTDEDESFGYNYYAYHSDLKVSVNDGDMWSAPQKITNTADKDEREVSVYGDVIDNKIHMLYFVDGIKGCDRQMVYYDQTEDLFVRWAIPATSMGTQAIRKPTTPQVDVVYQEFDLSGLTGVSSNSDKVPGEFSLEQNYPNPFNPTTDISYTVPAGDVKLAVYNTLGQKVKTLVDHNVIAGKYSAQWDGTNADGHQVTSGLYFYRLESEAGVKVNKMMLQK